MLAVMLLAYIGGQTPFLVEAGLGGADYQLPGFVDDCGTWENESLDSASGLWPQDGVRIPAQLCENERDVYALVIPPGTWVSLAIEMSGTGQGDTDLDLWEVATEPPDESQTVESGDDEPDFAVASYSATEKPFEWLAWYNPDDVGLVKYVVVDGWGGASDDYELVFQVIDSDQVLDCDAYDDTRESSPCDVSETDSPDALPDVDLLVQAEGGDSSPADPTEKLREFVNTTMDDSGPAGWPPTSFAEARDESEPQEASLEIPIDDHTASFMTKLTQVGIAGISLLLGLVAVEHVQSSSGRRLRRPNSASRPPQT